MDLSKNFLGSNINRVKYHNLRAILLSLLETDLVSRVQLAQKLSLSNTTITNLTAELLEQGIIAEEELDKSDKPRGVGRPRRMLRLIPSARYAVGVHVGVGLFRVAITDLHAKIIHNEIRHFDISEAPEEVIDQIALVIKKLIQKGGIDPALVIGVGLGASGLVNNADGINVFAPRLGWNNVPIKDILERNLDLPICVDNNVRTMALAEAFFGKGRDAKVLAFVYARVGVGAGIVVDGQIFRGSGAGAGEIGHNTILPHGGNVCTCGNTGCLETLIAEPVWLQHIQNLPNKHLEKSEKIGSGLADYQKPIERIFTAARNGDTQIQQFIHERADYLGIALANLVNVLNPELIILGGILAQGSDLILPVAEARMRSAAFARLGENVQLKTTSFSWQAGVVGAASLALVTFFYHHTEKR